MIKEGSTKIVNFKTPGAGVLMLGRGHISYIVNRNYLPGADPEKFPGRVQPQVRKNPLHTYRNS